MKYVLLLFALFLVSCSVLQTLTQQQAAEQQKTTETQKEPPTETETQAPEKISVVAVKCEDLHVPGSSERGKVVIYYSNEQKESFGDYCAEGGLGFRIIYYCSNLTPKTKVDHCDESCSKGACI